VSQKLARLHARQSSFILLTVSSRWEKNHVKAKSRLKSFRPRRNGPSNYRVVCLCAPIGWIRTGRLQSVHLSPAARVRRRGTGADVHAVWQRHQLQGLHRSRHQSKQMLRYISSQSLGIFFVNLLHRQLYSSVVDR